MTTTSFESIGTPGQAWGANEVAIWRARQRRQRRYADDVVAVIDTLRPLYTVSEYGRLDAVADGYPAEGYALYALSSGSWQAHRPSVLITGGVHGYETSGVHGALRFAQTAAGDYLGRVNLLIAPCVSPWAYETIQRWNPQALDPNRSFSGAGGTPESAALMRWVASSSASWQIHIDLHETTDTDESEFRPALAARDGVEHEPGEIPDGFYLVDDSEQPQPAFQQAIIDAVSRVTHIAPADARGQIIGSPVVSPGVIHYPLARLGLCAGMTNARYRTTTEVYPDSARATPEQCIAAQVAAICAAIDHVLTHTGD